MFLHQSVSHSVHRGDVPQHAMGRGVYTPTPLGRHPSRTNNPPPPETATEVGATHPTGMHSCFCDFFVMVELEIPILLTEKDLRWLLKVMFYV